MSEDGICKIKTEYVLPEQVRVINLENVSEKDKELLGEPAQKKPRIDDRKKLRGQNKKRGNTYHCDRSKELCNTLVNLTENEEPKECTRKNCQCIHDATEYLKNKPEDIGDTCYNFLTFGRCNRGLSCRFGKSHISPEGKNVVDAEKVESFSNKPQQTQNQLQFEVQVALRKKNYDFNVAESVVKYYDQKRKERNEKNNGKETEAKKTEVEKTCGAITDEDLIKLLPREKKKIDFTNKLFLSPLTTVGNLPFRRICKEFGADVTCGEMAMCTALLQGAPQEWALVKRHHTEDLFGVQLCGNNPHTLTKCAQLLDKEANIDFIDVNLGCPIDLVFREGGGCGLLRRQNVLETCVKGMSTVLSIPLTLKTRMGVYTDTNIAHTLVPKFRDWGASLVTIHGRSREQRYTRKANWSYIKECVQAASPLPILGNGDILSYEDYKQAMETCPQLAGVMIGRGGLIKPWIFTEIKEQRLWDISSKERFDILKKYTNYGLEHWGSDIKGVENTRRFMLEWLSFLYRYIPVGVLEQTPQRINQRPPMYRGRDELETLMASPSAADWVKISEMLLGPVPDGFQFVPKHKANSYQ